MLVATLLLMMLKRSVENSIPKSRAKGWNSFMKTLKQYQVLAVLSCLIATGFGSGSVLGQSAVTLLDGKLKLELADAFAADASHSSKQSIADYKARNSDGWGSILRGTHGLQPDGLDDYAKKKVADYIKGLSWLPRLNWLKNEIVT